MYTEILLLFNESKEASEIERKSNSILLVSKFCKKALTCLFCFLPYIIMIGLLNGLSPKIIYMLDGSTDFWTSAKSVSKCYWPVAEVSKNHQLSKQDFFVLQMFYSNRMGEGYGYQSTVSCWHIVIYRQFCLRVPNWLSKKD